MEKTVMEWIELGIPFGPVWSREPHHEMDSLQHRGLSKAGVLIEMINGKRLLIGHINDMGGTCDDCTEIKERDIVARYCVVWSGETP